MKTRRNPFTFTVLGTVLVLAGAVAFGSCQDIDDRLNGYPEGSIPLVLGEVNVGAPATVATRATTENPATGYTGIRKSLFVAGDEVNFVLDDNGSTRNVTATLGADGAWSLGSTPVYIQPGKTVVTATYTATEQASGIEKDHLNATNADCTLTGSTLNIAMKHTGAMIDITPSTGGVAITSITLNTATTTIKEEEQTTNGGTTVTTNHYRTIAAVGSPAISTLTAVIGGVSYEANLSTPITVEANKRYPIALTFKNSTLTATTGAPESWTDGGELNNATIPAPYTRIIGTPEALAQFAKDVNDDAAGTGARVALVLQTADLDMSQLKTAAEANAAAVGGVTTYNYTATKDNWVSIGIDDNVCFQGIYNGNGHAISNVKIVAADNGGIDGNRQRVGFFGVLKAATLTGIHLRNISITDHPASDIASSGALASWLWGDCVVSLCSATGTIAVNCAYELGGLIAVSEDYNNISRCSARVNVSLVNSSPSTVPTIGGFVGKTRDDNVSGCSSVATITWSDGVAVNYSGGFVGEGYSFFIGCYSGGTIKATGFGFCGNLLANTPQNFIGCYSDVSGAGNFVNTTNYNRMYHGFANCVYTGADNSTPGIEGNVAPTAAYAKLTASGMISVKTLHWSPADGYTLNVVSGLRTASSFWKNVPGSAPIIDLASETVVQQELYEGASASMLSLSHDYWIAPTNKENNIAWNAIPDVNAVCPAGWKIPTKSECLEMLSLADETSAWGTYGYIGDAIMASFGSTDQIYFTSTTEGSNVWTFSIEPSGNMIEMFTQPQVTTTGALRCVKKTVL